MALADAEVVEIGRALQAETPLDLALGFARLLVEDQDLVAAAQARAHVDQGLAGVVEVGVGRHHQAGRQAVLILIAAPRRQVVRVDHVLVLAFGEGQPGALPGDDIDIRVVGGLGHGLEQAPDPATPGPGTEAGQAALALGRIGRHLGIQEPLAEAHPCSVKAEAVEQAEPVEPVVGPPAVLLKQGRGGAHQVAPQPGRHRAANPHRQLVLA